MRQSSFEPSQKIHGVIEHLGSRGEGVFHVDSHIVFVPKSLPGDEIIAEVTAVKSKFIYAKAVQFLKRGPDYQEPLCRHFMHCGGCDFQHLPYPKQIEWKSTITQHWIHRSALKPFIKNTSFDFISSPHAFHYRNRVRLQVIDGQPAFHEMRSHQPVLLKECPILVNGFFSEIETLCQKVKNEKNLNLLFVDSQLQDRATYQLENKSIWISKDAFSQANLFVNEKMWLRILEDVESFKANRFAIDIFCGSGNFTLGLEDRFEKVVGIERNDISINLAKMSSSKIEWLNEDALTGLNEAIHRHGTPDFALLDPSREGALEVCRSLAKFKVKKITYVSCQLDTLIRDLVCLAKKNNYHVDRWTTVDLMPQTKHIESIVSLTLRD